MLFSAIAKVHPQINNQYIDLKNQWTHLSVEYVKSDDGENFNKVAGRQCFFSGEDVAIVHMAWAK